MENKRLNPSRMKTGIGAEGEHGVRSILTLVTVKKRLGQQVHDPANSLLVLGVLLFYSSLLIRIAQGLIQAFLFLLAFDRIERPSVVHEDSMNRPLLRFDLLRRCRLLTYPLLNNVLPVAVLLVIVHFVVSHVFQELVRVLRRLRAPRG